MTSEAASLSKTKRDLSVNRNSRSLPDQPQKLMKNQEVKKAINPSQKRKDWWCTKTLEAWVALSQWENFKERADQSCSHRFQLGHLRERKAETMRFKVQIQ